jgi:hypothetical protein
MASTKLSAQFVNKYNNRQYKYLVFVASTDENLVVHDHSVVVVEEPTLTVEAACLKKK